MRVGGPADLLVVCHTAAEVSEVVRLASAHDTPCRVLGGGCNVLVADAGVRGLVVINRAGRVRCGADGAVWAECGASMAALAQETVALGLAGLEWAAGLPGTVGGAIVGNAGAFDGDVAAVLSGATMLGPDGEIVERTADWFDFRYRGSRLKGQGDGDVLLTAAFTLRPGDAQMLAERVAEILHWRRTRHPSGATMGSTFKNPPGGHAGKLIEQVGLKGARVGGAMVSEQHGNFLLNTGQATAADTLSLIRYVQAEVERRTGVALELEIELVGAW